MNSWMRPSFKFATIKSGAQIKIELIIDFYHYSSDLVSGHFRFKNSKINFALPTTLTRLIEYKEIDRLIFKAKWKAEK